MRSLRFSSAIILLYAVSALFLWYSNRLLGIIFTALPIIVTAAIFIIQYLNFNNSSYKKITHNSYIATIFDKGKFGEYEIYRHLKRYEKDGCRFLFNIYLPTTDGRTTELDVLMICSQCIFVFESKNYSGWIFGNDKHKKWTQVLPKGRRRSQKNYFYNPIWQNEAHCNVLKDYISQSTIVHSIVLFSNRCTFKDISLSSDNVEVSHRRNVLPIVKKYLQVNQISEIDIDDMFNKLFPYTQVSDEVKRRHIEDLESFK